MRKISMKRALPQRTSGSVSLHCLYFYHAVVFLTFMEHGEAFLYSQLPRFPTRSITSDLCLCFSGLRINHPHWRHVTGCFATVGASFSAFESSPDNNYDSHKETAERRRWLLPSLGDDMPTYDDRKPRRAPSSETTDASNSHESIRNLTSVGPWSSASILSRTSRPSIDQIWGVHQSLSKSSATTATDSASHSHFSSTVEQVADEAYKAIAATLHGKLQEADPYRLFNMWDDSSSARRPVRNSWDVGRIGIEIDGSRHMFAERCNDAEGRRRITDAQALRRLALVLAGKLSQRPWSGFEDEENIKDKKRQHKLLGSSKLRPVAVYFNTIKQTLAASHDLQLLRRAELLEQNSQNKDSKMETTLDQVTIHCLGQGGDLPNILLSSNMNRNAPSASKRHAILKNGAVDPTAGLLLVVQPTDYNDEYRPPGPAVGIVESLQRLVARAGASGLATIVLSPRFLADQEKNSLFGGGFEQSGYQRSATFGGREPPKGPTPWLLRDFSPPVYCWIGNALVLPRPKISAEEEDDDNSDHHGTFYYSRLALEQSVLHPHHSWHIFAYQKANRERSPIGTGNQIRAYPYQYLASTSASAGRPTRDLLRRVLELFLLEQSDHVDD